ncbi:hypothetical protein IFO70_08935 [Phormidium tenue FACHB-886]|nr:hypothetical protein [Phormidium tenue FACHB-886]
MTTYNIGSLSSTVVSKDHFSVNDSDMTDVFAFTISGTKDINLALNSEKGNTNLNLYRDTNANGQLDGADELLAKGKDALLFGGNEGINYTAGAGAYLAQIVGGTNLGIPVNNRIYSLDLSATTGSVASNLLPKEIQVGTLANYDAKSYSGKIDNTNTADVYAFNYVNGHEVKITLSGLSANADMRLIRDLDNNGIVNGSEVAKTSVKLGSQSEQILTDLALGGNYLLQVYQVSGNTNYNISFQSDIGIG